jgi:hypothetical protein
MEQLEKSTISAGKNKASNAKATGLIFFEGWLGLIFSR